MGSAHDDEEMSKRRAKKSNESLLVMLFGIDLRSLALMRVCLSIILLLDLYVRSWYLHDHYTQWAVLPPYEAMHSHYAWGVHFINATTYFQYLLFILNAVIVLALMVGYHTRISSVLAWIMLVSLHNRNPYLLNAGDDMLRLFVFWGMFLPLGARYSIDSIHNSTQSSGFTSRYCFSVASIAAMVQFCMVYWFTAALKTGKEWNEDYTATYYALHLDQFATRIGIVMREYTNFLKFLTFAVIIWEWYGPLCFFVPIRSLHGPFRLLGVLGFVALHIGFGSCLSLGFFMWIPGACCMLFLPAWFWDNLLNFLRTPKRLSISIYYNAEFPLVEKALLLFRMFFLLHETPILSTQEHDGRDMKEDFNHNFWFSVVDKNTTELHYGYRALLKLCEISPLLGKICFFIRLSFVERIYNFIASKFSEEVVQVANYVSPTKPYSEWPITLRISRELLAGLFLLYIINWNFASFYKYPVPNSIRWVAPVFKIDQWWGMFSPHPPKIDGWLVMPAKLADGSEVDIFQGGKPISYEKPELIYNMYPTQRWRKFLMSLQKEAGKDKRIHYGRYLCREWNFWNRHPPEKQLVEYKIIFMVEKTADPDQPPNPITQSELWSHKC